MNRKATSSIGALVVLAGSIGAAAALAAGENKPSEFGRVGNQGEGFQEEETIKGKGQDPESTIKQDTQVTLGGARPIVEGRVTNIQGDDYLIRDLSGSEVHLRVNKDTNMECGPSSGQGASMSTGRHADDQREIPPTSHMQERMSSGHQGISEGQQGQSAMSGERVGDQSGTQPSSALGKDSGGDIARGSGFTIGPKGDCSFKPGDQVRAQVSDLGTVLHIKQITDQDTGPAQHRSAQMVPQKSGAMPGEKASAQQRADMLKPGAAPAPPDQQNPDLITREGKRTAKVDTEQKSLCESCKVVRGLVMKSEPDSLTVKDSSEKEVKMKIDMERMGKGTGQFSQPRAATFVEGDRVEAMVTPDGYAWSITALKQQQGQPGVLGAPGD